MNIIKISILISSPRITWTYRQKEEKDFWDDISEKISNVVKPAEPIHKSAGSFQHFFYLAADKNTDYYMGITSEILNAMFPDPTDRKGIIVSVTVPDATDLNKLRDAVGGQTGNEVFWREADAFITNASNETNTKPENRVDSPWEKNTVEEKDASEADVSQEDALEPEDTPREPLSLSEQAEKIKVLKEGLLSSIKGQRHAVDEVVRGIFESVMFAAHNENRKGPLATFLFAGPSGVGKTFLAKMCEKLLGRKMLVVDMSEYSSNLANTNFNGEHNSPAVVTGFVRKHPDGIILFDEVEKAHINTIHLFLQILDAGRMMDHQLRKEVSFRDNIIIMTTNAGKDLYDDETVCDLSNVPRSVILDGLRSDINPQTREPFFPECITTRMANGNVILFNHLEPFALMEIVSDEIDMQMKLFEKSSGIKVNYDSRTLSALVLYYAGGVADARTLRGLARNVVVRELQEVLMQLLAKDKSKIDTLKTITINIDTDNCTDVKELFVSHNVMNAVVFSNNASEYFATNTKYKNTSFNVITEKDHFLKSIRGVVDYVLLDPLCNAEHMDQTPSDIEDIDSEGMEMFEYMREFYPEIPIYILDRASASEGVFDTLLAKGARGIIRLTLSDISAFEKALDELAFNALINNGAFSLGRSGKVLSYNCAQYMPDDSSAIISFEKLQIKSATKANDKDMILKKGTNTDITFKNVIGCKAAKATLEEYARALDNPRETALSSKRMPKGVLLYGPPGTGKTLLAKAMANECNATFIPTTATSFFGPLVGETEKNIREIFKKARKYAPSIIFIDEVDAIGRCRTGGPGSIHNEDALNTFLAEMDGFVVDEKRPVFILAATNYELQGEGGRILDPAFVRRFDSKLYIPLPDTDDRYELLCASLKKHGIHFGVNHESILRNMAERTGGMNNADLESMNLKYARLIGDGEPDPDKYLDTLDEYRFGEVNKMDPEQLRQTACHEAGHAIVCRLFGVTPSFLTIVSRGNYGGFMQGSLGKNPGTLTYEELTGFVCRCLAGRVAEVEMYGENLGINTGASGDISMARYYIRAILDDYAMGKGLFGELNKEEAEALMVELYNRTRNMIREHRECLEHLTDLLVKEKSLDTREMKEFFEKENI